MTVSSAEVVARLVELGQTVGCAESLTGGLVVARLVDTPGASAVVRGGVVAYATPLKASLLGVDADLLASRGAVDPDVAGQMAVGAQRVLEADWGVATTGVAGPEPQDGMPVGCVFVAVAEPGGSVVVERHDLPGGRPEIRAAAVDAALALLAARILAHPPGPGAPPGAAAPPRGQLRSSNDRNKDGSWPLGGWRGGADASRGRMSPARTLCSLRCLTRPRHGRYAARAAVSPSAEPARGGWRPRAMVETIRPAERTPRRRGSMVLLRRELGDVLREERQHQGRTLREVSSSASVSLGYLSEVERGEKEASSELLGSICGALGVPLSEVLREVSTRVAHTEAITAPVTLPVGAAAPARLGSVVASAA